MRYFSLAPHPNLVRLLDLRCHLREPARSEGGVCLVMENAGTSVHTLMRANPGTAAAERPTMGSVLREIPESGLVLPLGEVRDLCWQLLQGLRYIHEAGFMHRDIKSVNVLLRELAGCGCGGGAAAAGGPPPPPRKGQLKLADFGMSRSTKKEGPAASAPASPTRRTPYILQTSSAMTVGAVNTPAPAAPNALRSAESSNSPRTSGRTP